MTSSETSKPSVDHKPSADQKTSGDHKTGTPDLAAILAASSGKRKRGNWGFRIAVVALLAAAAGGYLYFSKDESAFVYTTQAAKKGDLSVVVTATGSVQPTDQVDISSEQSGTVRKVNVTYNSPVKVNDVLAELDTNKLAADVQSARAKLASSKANVAKADADLGGALSKLDRLKSLVQNKVSTQQDLDTAQFSYDSAKATKEINEADVLSSEADLRLAEVNLGKSRIVSPIDGVVLTRDVDPGATVASSLSAPVLFTIAGDLRKMELQVSVDEADVGQVAIGQQAKFTVDAYPEMSFPAAITTVRFASETVSNVVTYKAILSVDNEKLLLRPGMTATADITVEAVKDALLLPNAALRYAPSSATGSGGRRGMFSMFGPPSRPQPAAVPVGNDRAVWVLRDNLPVRIPVTIGATDGQFTVLKSGDIKDGEALITDETAAGK